MKKQLAALAIAILLSAAAHAKGAHASGGKAGGGPRAHAHPIAPHTAPHAVPVRSGGKPPPKGPPPASGCPLALPCVDSWRGTLLERSVFRAQNAASCFCDPSCDEGFRCEGDAQGEACGCVRAQ